MAKQNACATVQHHLLPVLHRQHVWAERHDHRHAKGTSHDRRMGGHTAAGKRDSFGMHGELGDIGWAKRGGDDDTAVLARLEPAGARGRAAANAANIVGPQSEHRVFQLSQLVGALIGGLA